MRNIALYLSYLGTDYHGWQMQKNLATVQETMEKAIAIMLVKRIFDVKCEISALDPRENKEETIPHMESIMPYSFGR